MAQFRVYLVETVVHRYDQEAASATEAEDAVRRAYVECGEDGEVTSSQVDAVEAYPLLSPAEVRWLEQQLNREPRVLPELRRLLVESGHPREES